MLQQNDKNSLFVLILKSVEHSKLSTRINNSVGLKNVVIIGQRGNKISVLFGKDVFFAERLNHYRCLLRVVVIITKLSSW